MSLFSKMKKLTYYFIDRVFYRLTYPNQRTGGFIVLGSHENKINAMRIACIVEY